MSQLATMDAIDRKIDRQVAGAVSINPKKGLVVESLGQAMELAKLMSVSDTAVPKHLRGNPGACLSLAIQGYEWGINPFALANKSYVVNDRIAYESALYHAVVQRRAPIKGRIKSEYEGDGANRVCRVWAILDDGSNDSVEYTSPKFGIIPVKNSPLWKGDPDQQLFYYSVRAFSRRHFPDVMMGIYTVDELIDIPTVVVTANQPQRGVSATLGRIQTSRPVSEGQQLVDMETGEEIQTPEAAAPVATADAPKADAPQSDEPQLTPRESWWINILEVGSAAGITDEKDMRNRVKKWSLKVGLVGKEESATSEQTAELAKAVQERQGYFA